MSTFPNPYSRRETRPFDHAAGGSQVLVTFFNTVYAWMAVGLATTALVAWIVSGNSTAMAAIFNPAALIVLFIAQIALVIAISAAINKISAGVATAMFVLYAALMGMTLSAIFLVYALGTIATAFVATAGMFGAMSLVGFITKKDLSSLGSFLFMGLIGLVIASIVNIFWANSTLDWIITYAGIAIFLGLTVYDTSRLKQIAYATAGDQAMAARLAISGALTLYLDFINLFLFMLKLLASRER